MLKKNPAELIRGERLSLRKHELALASEMYRLADIDRQRLGRFLPWVVGMHSVADEEEYIRISHNLWDEFKAFDYGIYLHEGSTYVGNIGTHHNSWEHERCELGYWIAGAFEGKGIISEAVLTLEKELFRIGFHRLEIRCDPANARSAAVPKRCGYELEALLKDHKIENGRRRGTMVWAKLSPGYKEHL